MTDSNLVLDPMPCGWQEYKLEDICERVNDFYRPIEGGETPYVGLEHIAQGFPAFIGHGVESDVRSSKTAFKAGDVLFGKLRPYLRKVVLAEFDGVCSTDILTFRAQNGCDSKFLTFLLHSNQFVSHAKSTTSGVQHPRTSWPSLKEFRLSLPPLPEQKKIAYVLSTVQQAIEQQERIIQITTELKKALMYQLFTEGLRGEPQKMTEIGPVPESWPVVELGELLEVTQYGLSVRGGSSGRYPILRMTNQVGGKIVPQDLQFVDIPEEDFSKFAVVRGDILFNRTNSFDLVGRTAIFDLDGEYVFASYLIRIRTNSEKLDPFYLNHYFNCDETQARLKTIATRAVSQSNISATRLRGFPVPIPKLDEQQEMVGSLDFIERKIANCTRKKLALEDLFRTLLHRLMTAQIRVHEIEFEENV